MTRTPEDDLFAGIADAVRAYVATLDDGATGETPLRFSIVLTGRAWVRLAEAGGLYLHVREFVSTATRTAPTRDDVHVRYAGPVTPHAVAFLSSLIYEVL